MAEEETKIYRFSSSAFYCCLDCEKSTFFRICTKNTRELAYYYVVCCYCNFTFLIIENLLKSWWAHKLT